MNKKLIPLIFLMLSCWTITSCKKDNFNYPAGRVGSSKIIYFPSIGIKGDRLIIAKQGDFTDPGADASLNGKPVQYTSNINVNKDQPGVYNLVYTAISPDGYSATDWRTVVVIGNDVSANDFSGVYLREATGVTSTWTKTAPGVYNVENAGGAASGVGLNLTAVNYTGTKIAIPVQESADYGGLVSSQNEAYSLTPAPPMYSWIFHATNYGTSLRTFIKQ